MCLWLRLVDSTVWGLLLSQTSRKKLTTFSQTNNQAIICSEGDYRLSGRTAVPNWIWIGLLSPTTLQRVLTRNDQLTRLTLSDRIFLSNPNEPTLLATQQPMWFKVNRNWLTCFQQRRSTLTGSASRCSAELSGVDNPIIHLLHGLLVYSTFPRPDANSPLPVMVPSNMLVYVFWRFLFLLAHI